MKILRRIKRIIAEFIRRIKRWHGLPARELPNPHGPDAHATSTVIAEEISPASEAISMPASQCEPDPRIALFCDRLRSQGRLLPSWEAMGLAAFLEGLARLDQAEDAGLLPWFEQFLQSLPPAVLFAEMATELHDSPSHAMTPSMPLHGGLPLSAHSVAMHRRALEAMAHDCGLTYAQALGRASR